MREIAHISDPHFGSEDPAIAAALLAELDGRAAPAPALVALSGDLTQRARTTQFQACRRFLDALPCPWLTVPGNHDVPLFHLLNRFLHPFDKYRRHINPDLEPSFIDDEIAVAGVNTAHSLTFKDGRITPAQSARVHALLGPARAPCKIVVAHHPFVLPTGISDDDRADGAAAALPILEDAGVNLVLSGHLHIAFASDTAGFRSDDRAIVAVHAGTCTSTRRRGEPNGYNRLTIDGDSLTIVHRVWTGTRFEPAAAKAYRRTGDRWRRAAQQPTVPPPGNTPLQGHVS